MPHLDPRGIRVGLAASLAFGLLGSLFTDKCSDAADDARKINWREDLAQARAEASSRDLLLWIQFTGPWCINCRRMERSTFVHPAVIDDSRDRFVPVKLRSDDHESLAVSLGLTSLPSTVIVRPNGEVVDRFEGYVEAESFEATLQAVLRREGRSAEQVAARAAEKAKRAERDQAIALAGYCPVTLLRDQKLVPGRPDLTAEHDGRVFRFADEATRGVFRARPDSFAPANDGRCPVSQVEKGDLRLGDPKWGVVYNGHLFLFKDAAERTRFAKDPERYAQAASTGRTSCPHCWARPPVAARRGPTRSAASSHATQSLDLYAADRIAEMIAAGSTLRR